MKVNFKNSEVLQNEVDFCSRFLIGTTMSTGEEFVEWISLLPQQYDLHSLRLFPDHDEHFGAFIKDYPLKTK